MLGNHLVCMCFFFFSLFFFCVRGCHFSCALRCHSSCDVTHSTLACDTLSTLPPPAAESLAEVLSVACSFTIAGTSPPPPLPPVFWLRKQNNGLCAWDDECMRCVEMYASDTPGVYSSPIWVFGCATNCAAYFCHKASTESGFKQSFGMSLTNVSLMCQIMIIYTRAVWKIYFLLPSWCLCFVEIELH